MRQIKFAWVCRNIHFNTIDRVELTDEMLLSGDRPSWITSDNCEIIAKILPTGIKDIDKIEVYESDIVESTDCGEDVGTFEVRWNAREARYFLHRSQAVVWWCGFDSGEVEALNLRIIGNIHEHKHLLSEAP